MIENLTLSDEKIGQLFMVIAYSNKSKEHKRGFSFNKKHKIGGLMFLQGGPKTSNSHKLLSIYL